MVSIWKWPLPLAREQELVLPYRTKLLCAKNQGGHISVWGLVDSDSQTTQVVFKIFGTGWNLSSSEVGVVGDLQYLDTVILGDFVWHVFYQVKRPRFVRGEEPEFSHIRTRTEVGVGLIESGQVAVEDKSGRG